MARKTSSQQDLEEADEAKNPARPVNMMKITATAGALAGAVARFVVGPLDVVKIRFQVQLEPIAAGIQRSKYTSFHQAIATIVKEEGIQALWRGTLPGQLLTIPYTAVQFVTLDYCKRAAVDLGLSKHPAASFVGGALAGAAGTVASYPFDLLRTTLAAQGEPKVYAGMMDAARGIVKANGLRGLYRGLGVTILEIMPYAALQFGLYDAFNAAATRIRIGPKAAAAAASGRSDDEVPTWQAFMCGLAAGTLAKLGTHPLDVAKKRFQVAGLQRSTAYGERVAGSMVASLLACVQNIAQKEGIGGFYKGAMPSLLKAAPSAAVTLTCYHFFLQMMLQKEGAKAGKSGTPKMH